jgi:hypothetical protein
MEGLGTCLATFGAASMGSVLLPSFRRYSPMKKILSEMLHRLDIKRHRLSDPQDWRPSYPKGTVHNKMGTQSKAAAEDLPPTVRKNGRIGISRPPTHILHSLDNISRQSQRSCQESPKDLVPVFCSSPRSSMLAASCSTPRKHGFTPHNRELST